MLRPPLIIALTIYLSGCMAYVTKENTTSFETWELCTLLHEPDSLYSDWIVIKEENNTIRAELERRGVTSKEACSVKALAESECINFGFDPNTTEYLNCRVDIEIHLKEIKQMKRAAHDAKMAAQNMQAQQIQQSMKLERLKQEQQWQAWELQQQKLKDWN